MTYDEPSGTETGPGWTNAILECHQKLKYLDSGYRITQIKEKFGGLRYYLDVSPDCQQIVSDIMDDVVTAAEDLCGRLCEVCGRGAKSRVNGGWYKTLCDEHDTRPLPAWSLQESQPAPAKSRTRE